MKSLPLTKDQLQKVILGLIALAALVYVYFSFFLGPLAKGQTQMEASIADFQAKIDRSARAIQEAEALETKSAEARQRLADWENAMPEGAPIAWFPPKIRGFFVANELPADTVRLLGTAPLAQPELADFAHFDWWIAFDHADFRLLVDALRRLEEEEPMLKVTSLRVRALDETPQGQSITLGLSALLKR